MERIAGSLRRGEVVFDGWMHESMCKKASSFRTFFHDKRPADGPDRTGRTDGRTHVLPFVFVVGLPGHARNTYSSYIFLVNE